MTNPPTTPTPYSETTYANLREAERYLIRAVKIESDNGDEYGLREPIDKIATALTTLISRIDDGEV